MSADHYPLLGALLFVGFPALLFVIPNLRFLLELLVYQPVSWIRKQLSKSIVQPIRESSSEKPSEIAAKFEA